jgi:hypothetical protein
MSRADVPTCEVRRAHVRSARCDVRRATCSRATCNVFMCNVRLAIGILARRTPHVSTYARDTISTAPYPQTPDRRPRL